MKTNQTDTAKLICSCVCPPTLVYPFYLMPSTTHLPLSTVSTASFLPFYQCLRLIPIPIPIFIYPSSIPRLLPSPLCLPCIPQFYQLPFVYPVYPIHTLHLIPFQPFTPNLRPSQFIYPLFTSIYFHLFIHLSIALYLCLHPVTPPTPCLLPSASIYPLSTFINLCIHLSITFYLCLHPLTSIFPLSTSNYTSSTLSKLCLLPSTTTDPHLISFWEKNFI